MSQLSCEICGRHPAKKMSFKGHQGFVVARREITIEGVFCRDHALGAFAEARGISLKGMWFSSGSLLFGALRAVWDSAQLLDLPDEVKDEPWVFHKFGCPKCNAEHYGFAGKYECETCDSKFLVLSCVHCSTIAVELTNEQFDDVTIGSCRRCKRKTPPPYPARNVPQFLMANSLVEIAANVSMQDGFVHPSERVACADLLRQVFGFHQRTFEHLEKYFEDCLKNQSRDCLSGCIENCHPQFLSLLLAVAVDVAQSDGPLTSSERSALHSFAELLGLDLREFLDEDSRQDRPERRATEQEWWIVLNVTPNATPEEIRIAYHKLARQFHPDVWHNASPSEQASAKERMTEINSAFDFTRSLDRPHERERQEQERQERERQERERQERERQERERKEQERKEQERKEQERKEQERKEQERKEQERQERTLLDNTEHLRDYSEDEQSNERKEQEEPNSVASDQIQTRLQSQERASGKDGVPQWDNSSNPMAMFIMIPFVAVFIMVASIGILGISSIYNGQYRVVENTSGSALNNDSKSLEERPTTVIKRRWSFEKILTNELPEIDFSYAQIEIGPNGLLKLSFIFESEFGVRREKVSSSQLSQREEQEILQRLNYYQETCFRLVPASTSIEKWIDKSGKYSQSASLRELIVTRTDGQWKGEVKLINSENKYKRIDVSDLGLESRLLLVELLSGVLQIRPK